MGFYWLMLGPCTLADSLHAGSLRWWLSGQCQQHASCLVQLATSQMHAVCCMLCGNDVCWHLRLLCRDVAKAGGKLPEGWTVRLGNKQPTGYFKDKVYTEAGTGVGAQEQQGARLQFDGPEPECCS